VSAYVLSGRRQDDDLQAALEDYRESFPAISSASALTTRMSFHRMMQGSKKHRKPVPRGWRKQGSGEPAVLRAWISKSSARL
jgi:hypothetical protein